MIGIGGERGNDFGRARTGSARVEQITLMIALFHLGSPTSHDDVTASQQARYQDPKN